MSNTRSVQQLNQELADQINEEARRNPQSPYAGKFVGIANGQVVVVGDTLDDVAHGLPQFEADPSKTFCIEAGIDYDAVQEIWSLL
jgi:peptide subunit release factor RF-3